MKNNNYLVLSAILLTVGCLFAAISVRAELFPPVSDADAPRTCNLGTSVTIVAGANGDATAPFPREVNCPSIDCPAGFTGTGQYLRWDYTFFYNGVNPSNGFLSVSNDTPLFFTSPTAAISTPICAGDSQSKAGLSTCEVRFLRFNANASKLEAAYLTSLGLSPRIATAGAKAGNFQQFCLLAGAGKVTTETGNAVTHVESQTPACAYEFEVSPGGHSIVTGTLKTIPPNNPDCPIEEDSVPPSLNGMVISGFETDIDHPIRSEGSCNYSYTNTSGGLSTITCSTCCVQKSTNKCVLKSSLTSPTTQCTSTSLNN